MGSGQIRSKPFLSRRLAVHGLSVIVAWPLLTAITAMIDARHIPYYNVTWTQAAGAAVVGLFLLAPDLLLTGVLALVISTRVFSRVGPSADDRAFRRKLWLEPVLMFASIVFGVLLWYPGVSAQALFRPIGPVPAVLLPVALAITTALGAWLIAPPGRAARLALTLMLVGAMAPAPGFLSSQLAGRTGTRSDLVVLGLDSISQHDDVARLRTWITTKGGAWYKYPVTPGLLTNSVWTSILTRSSVGEHGVFHTFQRFPAGGAALLRAASASGYRTVSVFPDQLTCGVGSEAGFDVDHSGPLGWRQIVLAVVENNSILLPIVKPLLPRFWPSAAPPNHAGTFTYDVDREVREILTAGDGRDRTLVMAHLTYLHSPAYPRLADLSWPEIKRIVMAPARTVRDRTLDWQDYDRRTDLIPIRAWKIARLESAIVSSLMSTGFLDRGRLVLFSDHGDRRGILMENFGDSTYHRVLLATVGLRQRRLDGPVSLIDIGTIAGIVDAPPAEPAVEFTIAPPHMWPRLVKRARLRWSGAVDLDERQLGRVFRTLERYRPWVAEGDATSAPVTTH